LNAFVLAGGRSTRMGRDKALVTLDGLPLVERMLDRLRSLGLTARISGSRGDLARFAEVVPDNFPGCGPLAGIEAALAASDTELNLFVAVDLPGMPADFLRWMAERAETSGAVATIPRFGARPQPLCAVYSRRLLAGVRSALTAGRFAALGEAIDAFDVEAVAPVAAGEWESEPSVAAWFRNVNAPGDLDELEAGWSKSSRGNKLKPVS
jgi:molybdenum cofactor guanylyltransferase